MLKLNLGCGDDVRTHGYLNVDLDKRNLPPEIYRDGDATSLTWLCEDGTVDEIVAVDLLEYIPLNKVDIAIEEWVRKLAPNGTITIVSTCLRSVCQAFSEGMMDISRAAHILYGLGEKRSGTDINTLQDKLKSLGLHIDSAHFVSSTRFLIKATKEVKQ